VVLDFLIVALVVFFLIRGVNRLMPKPKEAPAAPATKDCPYCLSSVLLKATRCPHCTSQLPS
jgi:large conductance mechanosensitive channel